MSADLFGNEVEPTTAPAAAARSVTNDLRVVTEVLNRAVSDCGYVVASTARTVFRRVDKEKISRIPAWEASAVVQLVDNGKLVIGGTHLLRCGAVRQSVRSVLVPKSTRLMLSRWNALKPLGNSKSSEKKGA
ncbi:hypothetical protein [Lentzea jiangxiensis]|uniref:Uncharacterized protein n=1 Tax=Lentzea jiangxiensis TaxID=641025 RepID=A0A1H0U435_9PSEU|nr:hypothetical protein [Lentzea jiangxiensis]SDP60891.1 hypothetical protein SAMN05421507_11194 [Lentzea jiangxiensis]